VKKNGVKKRNVGLTKKDSDNLFGTNKKININ